MEPIEIIVIASLEQQVNELTKSNPKIRKLFEKQKQFMRMNPWYPSLGRKKLVNVRDQFGNALEEIRLNKFWRVVFIAKGDEKRIVWLKICDHDEISRNHRLHIADHPDVGLE